MLNKLQKRKESGFTIIEVLIVLAIAGLILVVVFLAVPALQRSQRNNGRTSEASRFASAVANFVSNDGGQLPSSTSNADLTTISNDFGTFKNLQTSAGATLAVAATSPAAVVSGKTTVAGGVMNITTGAITTAAATAGAGDSVLIDTGASCGTTTTGSTLSTTAAARKVAVIYTVETTSGYNQNCITAE